MKTQTQDEMVTLQKMRLPELQARYAEVLGEETKAPNKTFLIRRILAALEQKATQEAPIESPTQGPPEIETTAEPEESTTPTEPKLTKLTVEELQARYLETVGRPTSSNNRRYIMWKITQAQKGRIPVGPIKGRRSDGIERDYKVLPLRIEADLVIQLDEARERMEMKSRMELLRRSLHAFLLEAGEVRVAELFAPEI